MHSSLAWLPRLLLGGVLLGVVLYFLPLHSPDPAVDDLRLPLPDFTLTDQDGNVVEGRDLIGKVWIASFVFTRCAGPCPQVSATMARIQKQLADQPDVLLLTFSVDPENDDPKSLREYADRYAADPARWRFLTGKPEEMQKLLRDGFRVAAEPAPGQKHSVTHSTKLALVDRSGWIRGYFDSLPNLADENVEQAQRDFERNLHRLYEKTAELLREGNMNAGFPELNASLNALASVLLVVGYVAIRARKVKLHISCMVATLLVSAIFLGCYLYYHIVIRQGQPTKFSEQAPIAPEWARYLYLAILLSHTVLAVFVPPLALVTAYLAWRGRLERHVRLARWTFPIWLYVSVTGVVVYWMLYQMFV